MVRCLKEQVEGAEIHYATKKVFLPLLKDNPHIDKIHVLDDNLSALTDHLKIKGSLLGVDIVRNKKVITLDVSYQEIINLVQTEKFSLIITPIGGQGFIFGRGNQQLTPEILNEIDKENIFILSTTQKLLSLEGGPFLIDTGDPKINLKLSGYYKVITGYHQSTVYKAIS